MHAPPSHNLARTTLLLALLLLFLPPMTVYGLEDRDVYRQTKAGTALIVAINEASGSISFGSGFFVDAKGLLVTNAHVIEGHQKLLVYVHETVYEAPEVVAVDPDSDLAALRVSETGPPFVLASDMPEDGVSVIAVGYPRITDVLQMGLTLHPTVFPVNVSGTVLGRSRITNRPTPFIQTTVPMNSGSSGGPLVRVQTGEVIGMVVHTVPYVGQAKDRKGAVVGSVMLRAGINYSIPAVSIRNWLVSQQLMSADAPAPSPRVIDSQATPRKMDASSPTADSFYATAHLLHTIAKVMKDDRDLMEMAANHYVTALELEPQATWRYHALGLAQASLGHWDEAITSYRSAMQTRSDDSVLLSDLGHALYRVKKTDQSISSYRAAIRADGCSKRAHTELGLIFMESEQWRDAITEFSRVSECHPLSPLVSYHWGLALEHEGRHQDALKVWETSLVADTSVLSPRDKSIAEKIREKVTNFSTSSITTSPSPSSQ